MKEQTKKDFNAPWKIDKVEVNGSPIIRIFNSKDELVTSFVPNTKEANRIICIPELFEALLESIFMINRILDAYEHGIEVDKFYDDYLKEYGNVPSGFTFELMKLAMDVKDGK